MKKLMVSVYDKVAKEHGEIVFVHNKDVAERFFRNEVLEKVKNPDDYELYQHGFYDSETGVITPIDENVDIVLKPILQPYGE